MSQDGVKIGMIGMMGGNQNLSFIKKIKESLNDETVKEDMNLPEETQSGETVKVVNNNVIAKTETEIHLEVKARKKNKYTTFVSGIPDTYDKKKMITLWKKSYCCNSSLQEDGNIVLTGDQRDNIYNYLITNNIAKEKNIIVHGF